MHRAQDFRLFSGCIGIRIYGSNNGKALHPEPRRVRAAVLEGVAVSIGIARGSAKPKCKRDSTLCSRCSRPMRARPTAPMAIRLQQNSTLFVIIKNLVSCFFLQKKKKKEKQAIYLIILFFNFKYVYIFIFSLYYF